jgi:hypothetical protein
MVMIRSLAHVALQVANLEASVRSQCWQARCRVSVRERGGHSATSGERTRCVRYFRAESDAVDDARSAASKCHRVVSPKQTTLRGAVHGRGLDIAKSVFQVHGVDADGAVVIRRRVRGAKVLEFFAELPPCLVGMEACATAHQWARDLKRLGHETRLMPPTWHVCDIGT